MKKLTDVVKASNNKLLKDNYTSLFINGWGKFPEPFAQNESVSVGTDDFNNSSYAQLGITTNMNGCFAIRKVWQRLFSLLTDNVDNLGYIYYDKDNDIVACGYCDETIDNLNNYISNKRVPKGTRTIHMKVSGAEIIEGCVEENGMTEQLKFGGSKGHTLSPYFFGLACYLYASNQDWNYKIVRLCNGIFSGDEHIPKMFTLLENDLILESISGHNADKASTIIPFNETIYKEACSSYTSIQDEMSNGLGTSASVIKPKEKPKKVSDIVADKTYDFGYTHPDVNELLIPTYYDYYEANEDVIDICKMSFFNHKNNRNSNFLLMGEAGTGKTTAAQQLARILGVEYHRVTCSANTESYDLLVNMLPNNNGGYDLIESELVKGIQRPSVIEIQEINTVKKASTLTILNSLWDDCKEITLMNGQTVQRHKDCIFVATMNCGYEGTIPLNQALLSRMNYKATFNLPEAKVLKERLTAISNLDSSTITDMIKCFIDMRKVLQNSGETQGVCSYRELVAWVNCAEVFGNVHKAAQKTIIPTATFDPDLQVELEGVVGKYFSII